MTAYHRARLGQPATRACSWLSLEPRTHAPEPPPGFQELAHRYPFHRALVFFPTTFLVLLTEKKYREKSVLHFSKLKEYSYPN